MEKRPEPNHTPEDSAPVLSVRGLGKSYSLYAQANQKVGHFLKKNLPGYLANRIKGRESEFWALKDLSFELKKGQVLGVIGKNGAGKSTLLQLLAGISAPTGGTMDIRGRVSALLELGAGFHPEFTGRENVFISGSILGFTRSQIKKRFDEIAGFADIGDFMDRPVRTYSSGMFLRLAFAVQACLEPDILLIDEVLAVGDISFQQKCHQRVEEMISRGAAVVLVTHVMMTLEKYADMVMVLDQGRNVFFGNPLAAMDHYHQIAFDGEKHALERKTPAKPRPEKTAGKWSSPMEGWPLLDPVENTADPQKKGPAPSASCLGVLLTNEKGRKTSGFHIGETACFHFEFELLQDMESPAGGVRITNKLNLNVHAKSSRQHHTPSPRLAPKGSRIRFKQKIRLGIAPGLYSFSVYLGEFDPDDLHASEPKSLYVVSGAGRFEVAPLPGEPDLPFYDMVDLEGGCSLQVIEPGDK